MILDFIRSRYKRWVDKRYLKKHNCTSWEQYNHVYDTCRDKSAPNLVDYYFGYKSIVHVRWAVITNFPSWYHPFASTPYELTDWCKEHCTDEFRLDRIHGKFINSKFVISTDVDAVAIALHNTYPEVFMAFKSEKDALLFKLRWI